MSSLAVLAALVELAVKAAATLLFLLAAVRVWYDGPLAFLLDTLRRVPAVRRAITASLRHQAGRVIADDLKISAGSPPVAIPDKGEDPQQLLEQIETLRTHKTDQMFAYVYSEAAEVLGHALAKAQERAALDFVSNDASELGGGLSAEQRHLVAEYMRAFMHENALNPTLFAALRRFEVELVQMTAAMLNAGPAARGNVTSGGTESVLMAVKTYRDLARARKPGSGGTPNIVAAVTVHPAFNKAAHYFGLTMTLVPVDPVSQTVDPAALRAAVTSDTVLLVASAPQYCHGIVDPVEEYGRVAREFGLPLHVDACFGGFMLPWVEKLGYSVPAFDFRVPEVTSVSADLHKYGFAPKGASVIVYRTGGLRKHQLYAYSGWPGGLFGSPTMAGTRPGGYLATAWVTLRTMGQEGFVRIAGDLMELTKFWTEEIRATGALKIVGSPQMTCFAITSNNPAVNVFVLADLLEDKGWKMERESNPDCLHVTVLPQHLARRDDFVTDIRACVDRILTEKIKPKGMAAVYGMVARVPAKELIDEFLLEFFNQIYS
ncbi:hypothetical protein BOX15_Mlig025281g3 [Macrostomum lignano]|uniref:sphinganine-1-phosphate aldolase n=1 Tax=Macrostomum lignano TaxID=282301 RepID=A0A267DA10_9PLAT|nr:hypothetical protein BOX15_Mlig025281g3 [Macrostomum lignano]